MRGGAGSLGGGGRFCTTVCLVAWVTLASVTLLCFHAYSSDSPEVCCRLDAPVTPGRSFRGYSRACRCLYSIGSALGGA